MILLRNPQNDSFPALFPEFIVLEFAILGLTIPAQVLCHNIGRNHYPSKYICDIVFVSNEKLPKDAALCSEKQHRRAWLREPIGSSARR
jgi:hypothetical protein